jgi:hypothetical protein
MQQLPQALFPAMKPDKGSFGHVMARIVAHCVVVRVEMRWPMTTIMTTATMTRSGLIVAALMALPACTSAPTYGTGTRSDVQLLQDVAGIMTVTPKEKEPIDYKPRPGLIAPASTAALPEPQESIAQQAGVMPESPEMRRKRLRDEATANAGNPLYKSPIINTGLGQVQTAALTPAQQQERFRAARAVQDGAYSGRRFLSDPPPALKVAATTAPVGDLGEPEKKKEARRKKEAQGGSSWSLRNLWPW